jgi:hypothetical protein
VFDHNLVVFKETHVASFLLKGLGGLFEHPINRQKYELSLSVTFLLNLLTGFV